MLLSKTLQKSHGTVQKVRQTRFNNSLFKCTNPRPPPTAPTQTPEKDQKALAKKSSIKQKARQKKRSTKKTVKNVQEPEKLLKQKRSNFDA